MDIDYQMMEIERKRREEQERRLRAEKQQKENQRENIEKRAQNLEENPPEKEEKVQTVAEEDKIESGPEILPPEQEVPEKPAEKPEIVVKEPEMPVDEPVLSAYEQKVEEKLKREPGRTRKKRSKTKKGPDLVQMRNFPRSLVALAMEHFPDASNRSDAVAAFMIVKSERSLDSFEIENEEIERLVKEYEGDKSMFDLIGRITEIEKSLEAILFTTRTLEVGLAYDLYDRLGFRRDPIPKSPRTLNMIEDGMLDLVPRIRTQSLEYRRQEKYRTGRPIR